MGNESATILIGRDTSEELMGWRKNGVGIGGGALTISIGWSIFLLEFCVKGVKSPELESTI
jgi:hypothetical protein